MSKALLKKRYCNEMSVEAYASSCSCGCSCNTFCGCGGITLESTGHDNNRDRTNSSNRTKILQILK